MSDPPRTSPFAAGNGLSRNGNTTVGVVGTGYVGLVTGACLAELGHSVICLDSDASKIALLRRGELPFYEPDLYEIVIRNHEAGRLSFSEDVETGIKRSGIVFVAVGTPKRSDDTADLSAICDVAATIGRVLNGPKIVVLKSTVPVETGEFVSAIIAANAAKPHAVDVVSNPEFLREGSAVADFMNPDRIVIGTSSRQAAAAIRALYASLDAPVVVTDVRASEMIKYAANAFLATKISFMNEIANICELVGVDVKAVSEGIALDPRIGSCFMSPGLGYGGSCFPKDVLALERVAQGQAYDATLLRAVDRTNRGQIGRTVDKIAKALSGIGQGTVACVLGLTFKPNTSDTREAPALELVKSLQEAGVAIRVHDPVALEAVRGTLGPNVTYCSDPYEAISGSDIVIVATEWDHYANMDLRRVKRSMRGNVVLDGRNCLDPESVTAQGLRYIGVGRRKDPVIRASTDSIGTRRRLTA